MNRFSLHLLLVSVMAAGLVSSSGCQTWGNKSTSTSWWKKSSEPVPPDAPENFGEAVKIDISWKDDVLPGPDGRLQRGVGGRVHFLDKNDKPIRVRGSLTVYGFDEHNGQATSPRPDKRFHFKEEELQTLYSQSTIGHSYSIWLPWDEQGYQRHVAVMPIFRAEDGRLLKGNHAQAVLHGPENPNPVSHMQEKQRRFEESQLVERVVFQSANLNSGVSVASGETPLEPTSRVRTISVPDSANAIRNSVQNGNATSISPSTNGNLSPTANQDAGHSQTQNSVSRANYEVRPYQPSTKPTTGSENAPLGTSPPSHWEKALDQFNKLGPRKNTGVTGMR